MSFIWSVISSSKTTIFNIKGQYRMNSFLFPSLERFADNFFTRAFNSPKKMIQSENTPLLSREPGVSSLKTIISPNSDNADFSTSDPDVSSDFESGAESTFHYSSSPQEISLDSSQSSIDTQSMKKSVIGISNFDIIVGQSCLPKRLIAAGIWENPNSHSAHESTRVDCGEDAFFALDSQCCSVLGIADGVGGWNSFGVNPALFAWELMECSKKASISKSVPVPSQVLSQAYDAVKEGGQVDAGSSTACIVSFDKNTGMLHSSNLGDSGFWVFRFKPPSNSAPSEDSRNNSDSLSDEQSEISMDLVYESEELQHHFNAPFQLAILPSYISEAQRKFFMADTPKDAKNDTFGPLMHGDIIVMATDGLFDNLFIDDVSSALVCLLADEWHKLYGSNTETIDSNGNFQTFNDIIASEEWREVVQEKMVEAAKLLVRNAAACASSPRLSPFSKRAQQFGWSDNFGGKVDDVTVLTGFVVAKNK